MRLIFRAIVAVIVLCLSFVALNWPYFKLQVEHYLYPPKPDQISQQAQIHQGPDRIVVRHLGIDAPLIYIEEDSEEAFQEALKKGVTHFTGTPKVGESGNAYYFGHSSDFITSGGDFKTVFALLPKIQPGEQIEMTDSAGRIYKYQVEKTFVVESDDLSVLEQDMTKRQLTLQTSYPLGTALRRFIVVAQLVE